MRVLHGVAGPRMRVDGHPVLLFAGSNSLDLAGHPEVVEAASRAAREWGCAAGGSRLINGNLTLHEELEQELAKWLNTPSALTFATGYMANVGVIPALVGEGDVVVSDALSHASIIDGCRLSRADVRVFPHGDLDALESVLRRPSYALFGAGGKYVLTWQGANASGNASIVLSSRAYVRNPTSMKKKGCFRLAVLQSGDSLFCKRGVPVPWGA